MNPEGMKVLYIRPEPRSITEKRRFLGLLQVFRQSIQENANIETHLTDQMKKVSGSIIEMNHVKSSSKA